MISALVRSAMKFAPDHWQEALIQITGNDALTGFTAPKILWVQKNEPEIVCQGTANLAPQRLCALQADRRICHAIAPVVRGHSACSI